VPFPQLPIRKPSSLIVTLKRPRQSGSFFNRASPSLPACVALPSPRSSSPPSSDNRRSLCPTSASRPQLNLNLDLPTLGDTKAQQAQISGHIFNLVLIPTTYYSTPTVFAWSQGVPLVLEIHPSPGPRSFSRSHNIIALLAHPASVLSTLLYRYRAARLKILIDRKLVSSASPVILRRDKRHSCPSSLVLHALG
jgi:hypothetical protein